MALKLALYTLGALIALPLVIATGLAAGAVVLTTVAAHAAQPALGRLQRAPRPHPAIASVPATRATLTGESSAA